MFKIVPEIFTVKIYKKNKEINAHVIRYSQISLAYKL